jgi:O-antigen ligase
MACPVFVAAANSSLHRYLRYFCCLCIPVSMMIILFTVSRAGIPIFAVVTLGAAAFCISWRLTPKKALIGLVACFLLTIFGVQSWDRLTARFSQITLKDEYSDGQLESRGYFLKQAKVILDDHFFGVGLNNWSYWVSKQYGARP